MGAVLIQGKYTVRESKQANQVKGRQGTNEPRKGYSTFSDHAELPSTFWRAV